MPDDIENKLPPAEMPPGPEVGHETARETRPQTERQPHAETINEAPASAPAVLPVAEPIAPIDPTVRSIELILSEDMTEQFKAMSPADQEKFKAKGEETVSKLAALMQKTAINPEILQPMFEAAANAADKDMTGPSRNIQVVVVLYTAPLPRSLTVS